MKTYGLIGFPLGHSFSRGYFTNKFNLQHIEATYMNFPIPSVEGIRDLLEQNAGIAGLNVTIPYKEQIISFIDELDAEAAKIGAVNVIKITWNNDKPFLKGYNSDVVGFTRSLSSILKPCHSSALVLGTGGAAKAITHGLISLGIPFCYVSRTPKAQHHLSYDNLTNELISKHKLIINTSPLGMYPNINDCPPIPYDALGNEHLVYDLIYNPEQTLFMKMAAERGATTKNGLEMLELQAEEAWRIWNEE